jgi:drug/metabolite transporter (DMT)-like permease
MAPGGGRQISRATMAACYFAVYFIWGSTFLAIKASVATAPIFMASGVRFLSAGVVLVAFAAVRGAARPTRENLSVALKSGALAFFASYGFLSWAETILPSSTAALIISLEPAWFVLFDWLCFGGPKPCRRVAISQAVGVAGCAILVIGDGSAAGGDISPMKYATAAAAVTLSGFSWVYGALLASKSSASHGNSAMASGLQMTCGGLVLMAAAAATGDFSRVGSVSRESWLAILYLVVFGSIVAYSAYVTLIRSQPAARVSTHSFVNPIVAVALGATLAGERITIYTAIAAAMIVISVAGIISIKE